MIGIVTITKSSRCCQLETKQCYRTHIVRFSEELLIDVYLFCMRISRAIGKFVRKLSPAPPLPPVPERLLALDDSESTHSCREDDITPPAFSREQAKSYRSAVQGRMAYAQLLESKGENSGLPGPAIYRNYPHLPYRQKAQSTTCDMGFRCVLS